MAPLKAQCTGLQKIIKYIIHHVFSFVLFCYVYGYKLKIPIGSVVLDFILIFVKFHIF